MQTKYLDHYIAAVFHRWFMEVGKQNATAPWTAVVQNFLYTQDPEHPDKLRIQSFVSGLRQFLLQIKDLPDPDPAPTIYEVGITEQAQKEMDELVASKGLIKFDVNTPTSTFK